MIKRLKDRMKALPRSSIDRLHLVLIKDKLNFIVIFRVLLLFLLRPKHICTISRLR